MDVTEFLPQIISDIKNPTIPQVEQLIRNIPCDFQEIAPHISLPTPPLTYGRNVIFQSKLFEVIVLNLPPLIETPIHDHGASFCCVKIIKGTLHNRIFATSQNREMTLLREEIYSTDDYFTVTTDLIHSMYNPNEEAVITFHIYSPPIRNNRYYPAEHSSHIGSRLS
ncbi:cysteine dioxygenase [Shimazuella alba]|uniref:Cysteine dioxygenase n=1 Tax=Shimazuella alba TaxID=2690964 RepID=A0A6I4W535_9BACL|nr:cysteine dioxygenase family protein [Shimazuella alba]MXQ55874.1 cysteine dioxygenase [Shimazuella alba]